MDATTREMIERMKLSHCKEQYCHSDPSCCCERSLDG